MTCYDHTRKKNIWIFELQMSPPPPQRKLKLPLHDSIHVPQNFHPASNKITDLYHETNSFPPPKKKWLPKQKKIFLAFAEGASCWVLKSVIFANATCCCQHRLPTIPTVQPVQDTLRYPTAWHPTVKVMVG